MLRSIKQTWKRHIGWRLFLSRVASDPDWFFRVTAPCGEEAEWIAAGRIAQHMPYTIYEVFPVVKAYGATHTRQACVYAAARQVELVTAAHQLFGRDEGINHME